MSSKSDQEMIKHDPGEGFDRSEPAARQITFFVVLSVISLIVVIAALQFYFDGIWDSMVYENVLAVPGAEVGQQRSLEAWRLSHYEYAEPSKSEVRLPLDRAKELFLSELKSGKTFYPGQPSVPKAEEPAKQEGKQEGTQESKQEGKQEGKQETKQ
jgi:hypothetical protein